MLRREIPGSRRSDRFISFVNHTIELRVLISTTGYKVKSTVRSYRSVCYRKRASRQKLFSFLQVVGSFWLQVNRIDCTERPVNSVKRTLIFCREGCTGTKRHTRGRSRTYIQHGGQAVFILIRPFAASASPAVITSTYHMHQPCGAVPRHPHIPLHIRVVGGQVSMLIQIGIKLGPVSDTDPLPLRSVGFDFCKITSGCKDTSCVSPCVPLPGQKLIFFPVGQAALCQI